MKSILRLAFIATVLFSLTCSVSCSSSKNIYKGQLASSAFTAVESCDGKRQEVEVAVFNSGLQAMFFEFPNGKWMELVVTKGDPPRVDSIFLFEGKAVTDLVSKTRLDGQTVERVSIAEFATGK